MRKIIAVMFVSLDGVIQAPGGPEEDTSGGFAYGGWIVPYSDEIIGEAMQKQLSRPFDLLLGRKTFEIWAAYWPYHEDNWPGVNEATKYVVSTTLARHEWNNSVFIHGNIPEEIKKLKQQNGPDIKVYGSSKLVQTLLKHDLIDEFWLKIYPITLGGGKKLFAEGTIPAAFTLIDSKVSTSGIIIASYSRSGDVKTGAFES